MKEAVVPNSAAGSANINSPLNDSDGVDAVLKRHETNSQRWGPAALEQRRARTRDHLAKIAARRETWSNCKRSEYELLNRPPRGVVEQQTTDLSVRFSSGNRMTIVRTGKDNGV